MEMSSPPPLSSPPPPTITPSPPAPRKSRGWMIAAIILIVLLVFSLFGNFTQFISHAFSFNPGFDGVGQYTVEPKLDEVLLENHNSRNKIAVITVDGIIAGQELDPSGNDMVDMIQAQLDRAQKDDRVKAVILRVDSPGGEVMAADEINRAIVKFQKDSGKPVICSMGSLAASGGYYISAPCRWIEANQLTITGSIGVIMHGWNYRGLMDKIGIAPVTYKSGKFKDMLSGDREPSQIPPEEHAMVQALIDQTYQKFKDVVIAGRTKAHEENKDEGHALALDWTNYADGRVLSGEQALKLGLVDQLGDFDDAVTRADQIAHIHNANLVEYREHRDLGDLFSMFSQSSSAKDIKLDLGLDMPKLHAGYLYFLSSNYLD
jgi:protease IV